MQASPHAANKPHISAPEIAQRVIARNHARKELADRIAGTGLIVERNLDCEEALQSIKVRCGREHPAQDEASIYGLLDELAWHPDPVQWSFFRGPRDVVRMRHESTDARLVMIVARPWAEVPRYEAA